MRRSAYKHALPLFDGATYNAPRDESRLNAQLWRVLALMRDGRWRSLAEIADAVGAPEASVSARLRDLRKERFGAHAIERSYLERGLWRYRLVVEAPRAPREGTV